MALLTALFGTMFIFGTAYLLEKTRGMRAARAAIRLARRRSRWPCRAWCWASATSSSSTRRDNPLNVLYGTMTILVLSTIVHYYTSSHLTAVTALKALDNEFEAVSASLKVPFYKTFFRVTVPVCLPAILDIARYLFVNAMVTISAVVFLYSPDTKLASVAIVNLDEAGEIGAGGRDGDADRRDVDGRVPRLCAADARAAAPHAGVAHADRAPDLDPTKEPSMSNFSRDPILLTPGPLTTSLADQGRDAARLGLVGRQLQRRHRARARAADSTSSTAHDTHVCVPMQGSGTFAVEAAVNTLVPRDGHVLVLVNGAYGKRLAKLTQMMGRRVSMFETADDVPTTAADVERLLDARSVDHARRPHPLRDVDRHPESAARRSPTSSRGTASSLIVDAMSSFGALPIDARDDAVRRADRGVGQVHRRPARAWASCSCARACSSAAPATRTSLALDLHDQWTYMEKTTQWRFTPPTHVVVALDAALDAVRRGGRPAGAARALRAQLRDARSRAWRSSASGRSSIRAIQAPIIVTFHAPADPRYTFKRVLRRACATRASSSIRAS